MKHIFVLFLLGLAFQTHAQITITQTDLVQPGAMYTMTNGDPASVVLSEIESGGTDVGWAFDITPTTQQIDTMYALSDVPFIYQASFFQADYADRGTPGFSLPIPGYELTISNVYNFYNLNSAKLEQMGMGANVNGFDLPIFFSPKDVIYELPLTYGSTFTSNSAFNIDVPGFGVWHEARERVNEVDGWGTLDGPLGTQQVLRVKSNIFYTDSINVETPFGNIGIPFPRQETEYKWLSASGGVPLLQITTTTLALVGTENISRVKYRDVPNGVEETLANNQPVTLYPQPASNAVTVVNPYAYDNHVVLSLSDPSGRVLMNDVVNQTGLLNVDVSAYPAGIYLLTLQSGTKSFSRRLAVAH